MKILLFGVLADTLGTSVIETELTSDTDILKNHLLNKFPLLNNYQFQLAINRELVNKNVPINFEDEIALLPPFAGG